MPRRLAMNLSRQSGKNRFYIYDSGLDMRGSAH